MRNRFLLTVLVGVACVSCVLPANATRRHLRAAYPNSIAILGHSGSTGQDSDPRRPGVDVRENSWATGTNPAVNSLYLRILAKNPAIRGQYVALSQDGATVSDLVVQAQQDVLLKPAPELVVIQIMDNDIVCPAKAADYRRFGATLVRALAVIAHGSPQSRMFVVSQFGSVGTYAKSLTIAQRRTIGGTGPCDFVDLSGRIIPAKVQRLDAVIHGYEAQLKSGCSKFPQCKYDGGAFGNIIDKPEYNASDLMHFSIKGHAKAAATAWSAMRRVGIVP